MRQSSWEQLGLVKPDLTAGEKSKITGLTVKDFQKIAQVAMKEEKRQLEEQRALEAAKKATDSTEAQISETWECSACTYANQASLTECEMCQTKNSTVKKSSEEAGDAGATWTCNVCTFINEQDDAACEICSSAKGADRPPEEEEEKKED